MIECNLNGVDISMMNIRKVNCILRKRVTKFDKWGIHGTPKLIVGFRKPVENNSQWDRVGKLGRRAITAKALHKGYLFRNTRCKEWRLNARVMDGAFRFRPTIRRVR